MNLKDLISMFPDSKLEQDEETGSFYICPEKYQTKQKTGEPSIVFTLNISFKNTNDQKKSVETLNKSINTLNGVVENITIFDWN